MNLNIPVIKDIKPTTEVNTTKLDDKVIRVNGDKFRDTLNRASLKSDKSSDSNVSNTAKNDTAVDEEENINEKSNENNIVFVSSIPTLLMNNAEVSVDVANLANLPMENTDSLNIVNTVQVELTNNTAPNNQELKGEQTAETNVKNTPVNPQNLVAQVEVETQEENVQTQTTAKNSLQATDLDTESLQFVNQVLGEVDDIIKDGKNTPDLKAVLLNKTEQQVANVNEVIVEEENATKNVSVTQTKSEFGGEQKEENSSANDNKALIKGNESAKSDKASATQNNVVSANVNSDGKVDFKFAQIQNKAAEGIIQKQSIFEQIVQNARAAVSNQQNELFVQLKPAHLGGLMISLTMGEQGMMAKLTTGQKDVALMMQADLVQLQESLRDKGINVVHMDVIYDQMANSTSRNNSNNGEQWTSNTKSNNMISDATEDMPVIYDNLSMYDVLTEQGSSVEYKA